MNKICRLIWNEVNRIWVAVSEISQGRGTLADDETRFCRRPIHRAIEPWKNRPMNRPPTKTVKLNHVIKQFQGA